MPRVEQTALNSGRSGLCRIVAVQLRFRALSEPTDGPRVRCTNAFKQFEKKLKLACHLHLQSLLMARA